MSIDGLGLVNKYPDSKPAYYFLDGRTFRGCKSQNRYHLEFETDCDKVSLVSESNSNGTVYFSKNDMKYNLGIPC